ncbi:GerAB/ArcD/ProY family transporter [Paenibacillus sp. LMG 31460]|uniref:GerAB/ArcD/ProY family transporter n=1 Tax=Paenibacillus germinis TaxID=2654979 RepID=A0ABX1Z3C9_9BACL|nr:GerAB/ArcD/ProY family transporter [Paenibacillus germinis]NOU86438.1 GerAB/ArcD/ProY family transporter [Paenibacillus germinis]
MNQEKIGIKQLFLMMLAFEIGSAVIFALGAEAKQDAWLAVLIGMVLGLILMSVFTKLSGYYPNDSLIQIIQKISGRYIGYPLSITYIIYFTSQAARISRDFSDLMLSTILVGTPEIFILASFVAVIIYTLRGGIEVFGRMAEMVVPGVLLISISTWIIVYASGVVDLKQLTPVLGTGIKTVWKESFPALTSLPFGELVVFTMIWPTLKDNAKLKKVGMTAVLTVGVLLSLNIVGMISVLGPQLYGMLNYPLLSTIRMASVADFLERIDAVVILLMVAGGFFKVGVYIYGAAVGTAHLFHLKSYHSVLIPIAAIIAPLGHVMTKTYAEHLAIGFKFNMTYVQLPLQFVIPSLLLVAAYFHQKSISYRDPKLRQSQ